LSPLRHADFSINVQIVAPGFSDAVFEHVWRTTVEIYFEMTRSERWDRLIVGGMQEVPNVPELMSKVNVDGCGRTFR
jgi:hypothetical protein